MALLKESKSCFIIIKFDLVCQLMSEFFLNVIAFT